MRSRTALAMIAGAGTWLAVVMIRLRLVNEAMWIARDDAVITLSHARNAAMFGSIGVSPGGDRVEGFSSPLHFFVAYVIHQLGDRGYRSTSMLILVGCSAFTGAAVFLAMRSHARENGVRSRPAELVAVGLVVSTVVWVAASWSSVGWIGSGMENPVVVCSGMSVVALAASRKPRRVSRVLMTIAVASFLVARVEFAAFALPFAAAATWMQATRYPVERQLRVFAQTLGGALALVGAVHLLRRWYFGDWLPNTAVVQNRASGSNQLLVAALISAILLATAMMIALVASKVDVPRRGARVKDLALAGALLSLGLVILVVVGETSGTVTNLLKLAPLLPLLALIVAGALLLRALGQHVQMFDAVLLTAAAVPLGQYIALGPARLEGHRVASIAVPFLALWATCLAMRVVMAVRAIKPVPRLIEGTRRRAAIVVVAALVIAGLGFTMIEDETRRLNWEVVTASTVSGAVADVRSEHLGEGLVLLANPDLGKVSYAKNAAIIDLGLLGDPLLTRLTEGSPELVAPYLHIVARPDVVQLHGGWACTYSAWLGSSEFAATYEPIDSGYLDGPPVYEDCAYGARWIIWVRSDAQAEYDLTSDLITASDPAAVVEDALRDCRAAGDDPLRCQNVRRSLQRASAALRTRGTFGAAVAAMQQSPSAPLDLPLLHRGSGWASDAYLGILSLAGR